MVFANALPNPNDPPAYSGPGCVEAMKHAGLNVRLYQGDDTNVYCLIGATEKRLEAEACRISYDLPLDRHQAIEYGRSKNILLAVKSIEQDDEYSHELTLDLWDNIYGRYNPDCREIYHRYSSSSAVHHNSVFSDIDRIKLTISIIEADTKLGGSSISTSKMISNPNSHLIAFFPLHNHEKKEALFKGWADHSKLLKQPLDDIRDYYGESVAFYFGFLQSYNKWLLPFTILGILFFILQCVYGIASCPGFWVFAICVCIWAVGFLENWKRNEAYMRVRWGTTNFETKEQTRPEYEGNWIRSPVTGKLQEEFPWIEQLWRKILSQTVIMSMICIVIGLVVAIIFLRAVLVESTSSSVGTSITSAINAIQIMIFNVIYSKIALKLNSYENHRTDTEYYDHLIAKMFLFKFVNSYSSLFWYAYYRYYYESDADLQCTTADACMEDLAYAILIIFGIQLFVNNFTEIGIPFIKKHILKKDEEHVDETLTAAEQEFQMEKYESTLEDFDELVVQFGYVTLFAVAFPLTFLLAFINNAVETAVDSGKLLVMTRRPEPRGAGDIGTWQSILSIIASVSVITNVSVAVIYSDDIDGWVDSSNLSKLWIFLVTEHVLFLAQYAVGYAVPDVPGSVQSHIEREKYITSVLIDGALEEPDIDPSSAKAEFDAATYDYFALGDIPDSRSITKDIHIQ